MSHAQEILNEGLIKEDLKMVCELHADRVKFHSTYIEYIFSDGSTIIEE